MAEQHKALITFENPRGFCFAEDLADHVSIFVHQREVVDSRYLHVNDIITFDIVENPKYPGKFTAINVRYVGHNVARQTGENRGSR